MVPIIVAVAAEAPGVPPCVAITLAATTAPLSWAIVQSLFPSNADLDTGVLVLFCWLGVLSSYHADSNIDANAFGDTVLKVTHLPWHYKLPLVPRERAVLIIKTRLIHWYLYGTGTGLYSIKLRNIQHRYEFVILFPTLLFRFVEDYIY